MRQEQSALKITTRVVMLTPGLYTFRYATQSDSSQPPVPVTLQPAPLGSGSVDFFPAEGVSRQTLRTFGDCIVARVQRAEIGILIAQYHVPSAHGVQDVDIRIDQIDTSGRFLGGSAASAAPAGATRPSGLEPTRPTQSAVDAQPERLELLGHVQYRGDVRVTDGWLGDPNGQARIEGFAVEWKDRPKDVDLVYTCQVRGFGQTPSLGSGNFAGTRQKAAPITGVSMSLMGPGANDYTLTGELVFAGAAPLTIVNGARLAGPTGNEHLTAMRVRIARKQGQGEATVPRSPSPWDDPTVTQIFRSGSR